MELNTNNVDIEGSIKNVLSAVFKVKGEIGSTILPEGKNPYFGNDFIQLDSLVKKIDPACQKHGLGIMQFPTGVGLVTLIFHEASGEYISSYYELKLEQQTSQGIGSALSYAKRQTYQALFGLSQGVADPSDDDAHAASNPPKKAVVGQVTSSTAFQIARVALKEINSIVGLEAWKEIQPEVVRSNRQVIELVKAKNAELKMAS